MSRALPLQMLGSLLPDITARISRGARPEEIAAVYRRGSRILMVFTLLICGFLGGTVESVLRLWLWQPIEGAGAICVALLASYALNNMTGIGTTILNAEGRPRVETAYAVLSAVLNILVTIVLIKPFGLAGVVIGTITGNVVGSLFFLALFHRITGIDWWWSMGSWLWKLIAVTLCSAALASAVLAFTTSPETGWAPLLVAVGVAGLLYVICFAGLLLVSGFLEAEDRALVARWLPWFRTGS